MRTPKEAKFQVRDRRYKRQAGAASDRREATSRGARAKGEWYIWRIAPRDVTGTRSEHLRLNGKRFRWDDPPVINHRTGERGHPGHDPRCRCTAEPVPDGE